MIAVVETGNFGKTKPAEKIKLYNEKDEAVEFTTAELLQGLRSMADQESARLLLALYSFPDMHPSPQDSSLFIINGGTIDRAVKAFAGHANEYLFTLSSYAKNVGAITIDDMEKPEDFDPYAIEFITETIKGINRTLAIHRDRFGYPAKISAEAVDKDSLSLSDNQRRALDLLIADLEMRLPEAKKKLTDEGIEVPNIAIHSSRTNQATPTVTSVEETPSNVRFVDFGNKAAR